MSKPHSARGVAEGRQFVEMVAAHHGWRLNPDSELVDGLAAGLAANFNRYGFYQCPCRDSWRGDREKDADIACPCVYCAPDQQEYGHCFCGLYLTPDFAATGKPVRPIPERRPADRFPD